MAAAHGREGGSRAAGGAVRGRPAAPWSLRPGRRGRVEAPVDSGDGGAGRKKAGQGLAARRGAGPAAGRGPGSLALVRRGPARDGEEVGEDAPLPARWSRIGGGIRAGTTAIRGGKPTARGALGEDGRWEVGDDAQ
jgi:hypothetical protein